MERAMERLLVAIDDDDLSREVLTLIAEAAGFSCESFESGEAAVERLTRGPAPFAVLADMQMPGLAGEELARALREATAGKTLLLAMSGSAAAQETLAAFDGFLFKPFSADELLQACDGAARDRLQTQEATEFGTGDVPVLNEAVYAKFAGAMPPAQLAGLYRMCLDDATKRLETMRQAVEAGDDVAYRQAAHAIKGGCGMAGAMELAAAAEAMERNGIVDAQDATPFKRFAAAAARLERRVRSKADGM